MFLRLWALSLSVLSVCICIIVWLKFNGCSVSLYFMWCGRYGEWLYRFLSGGDGGEVPRMCNMFVGTFLHYFVWYLCFCVIFLLQTWSHVAVCCWSVSGALEVSATCGTMWHVLHLCCLLDACRVQFCWSCYAQTVLTFTFYCIYMFSQTVCIYETVAYLVILLYFTYYILYHFLSRRL